ncbi:MAG: spondin domain-containing protein [Cyanobacteria bacterium HKST-UBA06]|nr:spondin domain-containing protein [Candidatus Saccharibacteria bacterium]MCA9807336.1 spondin domain-containing protein [Cyanobacteria bacterium HKST-UBA06]MCB9821224.1 spondin domain-containing protein [Candidatus Nomurabacteria bacterium]
MKKFMFLGFVFFVIAGGLGYMAWRGVEESKDNQPTGTEQVADTTPKPASQTAKYKVVVDFSWSQATHPGSYPEGAHLSPIVLAVHNSEQALFTNGTQASLGIEDMAETGATTSLAGELDEAKITYVLGKRVDAPGSYEFEIEVNQTDSLVSLVSMLAPSPDWFVGLDGTKLFDNGTWLESVQYDLQAYDAGTDNGTDWTSANADTQPHGLISSPSSSVFETAAATPFGTATFTKL